MNIPRPLFYTALLIYFIAMAVVGLGFNTVTTGAQSLYHLISTYAAMFLALLTATRLYSLTHDKIGKNVPSGVRIVGFGAGDYGFYLMILAYAGYGVFEHIYINTVSTGGISLLSAILGGCEVLIIVIALSNTYEMLSGQVKKFAAIDTKS